jgi:alpha-mannosidase
VDGLPRVEQRSPEQFFARLEADAKELTTQVGELYFEYHRGTYTTQAANKRDNRRSEELLHDIEFLGAITGKYPRAELARLWELVLLNQFHDIIPGSSINEVYKDSAAHYDDILKSGAKLRQAALDKLVRPGKARVAVINTTGHDRTEIVTIAGKPAVVSAPAYGVAVQTPVTKVPPVTITETATGFVLENQHLRAAFTRAGHLTSLRAGHETIAGKANQFVIYDDVPMAYDAWDVDIYHLEKRRDLPGATSARVVERNPLRATIEFRYPWSKFVQRVSLDAVSRRLEFACECDWREDHKFLKVEFPTAIHNDAATYEIQFGHVQRPTHFNNSYDIARFEVCAYRWADLSEPGVGLALLNDCKYGHATHRNVMRLSLLRAPTHPDPVADRGRHQFRYALVPHAGDFRAAGIVQQAQAFNQPLLVAPTNAAAGTKSFFSVNNPAVVIDTVKLAEDSRDVIVRLYEAHGSKARVKLNSALPVKAAATCDFLEHNTGRLAWRNGVSLSLRPFEIVTVVLKTS